ncbi:MAG: acyl dehydratase, partial [Dehalococcoidia bacterium]|nr:acyl dehydratase [Dehalococcoidia bacterium]
MVDWSKQVYWEDVKEGDEVPPVSVALTVQRLIMLAGANRDFHPIHHNRDAAQAGGAPDIYINNNSCQSALGGWERTVREYIGLRGVIKRAGPFRMRIFNTPG